MGEELILSKNFYICGEELKHSPKIRFGTYALDIKDIGERYSEGISVYCFSRLMFPIKSKRHGEEKFTFNGPRLGSYYLMYDIRDGPVLNHFINELSIVIEYENTDIANIKIAGSSDTTNSFAHPQDYKKEIPELWYFSVEFIYQFKF